MKGVKRYDTQACQRDRNENILCFQEKKSSFMTLGFQKVKNSKIILFDAVHCRAKLYLHSIYIFV